jgi:hypothetical protein
MPAPSRTTTRLATSAIGLAVFSSLLSLPYLWDSTLSTTLEINIAAFATILWVMSALLVGVLFAYLLITRQAPTTRVYLALILVLLSYSLQYFLVDKMWDQLASVMVPII